MQVKQRKGFSPAKAIISLLVVAAMLAIAIAACSSPTATPAPTPKPTTPASGATPTTSAATAAPSPTPTAGPKITLLAATHNPETTAYGVSVKYFRDLVSKYTNGQVEMKLFYDESLVKGRDMLDGVRRGATDLGSLTFAYFPADLPFSNAAGMIPFAWDYQGAKALVPKLRPSFDEELAKVNSKMLWTTPQAIEWFFTKPVDPSNPSFAGMKVRTPGEPWTSVITAFGGASVSMASSEIAMALRTRVIDGATTTLTVYDSWDSFQDVGYVLITQGFINIGNPWVINLDKFKSLPKNVQDAIMKAADETQALAIDFSAKTDSDLTEKFKTKAKRVDVLTPDQVKIWKAKLAFINDNFIAKYGDRAKAVMAMLQ